MLQLKVEAIQPETADTSTFYLKQVNGLPLTYKAGQFITLVIDHHGGEIRRSYSLSSSPHENLLSVTIKRVANGEVSRFLHTNTKVGDIWNAVPPAGRFILPFNLQQQTFVYFAAGSGIVPAYAQIKYILNQHTNCHIFLFYSNLSSNSIIFKNQLTQLAHDYAYLFTFVNLISDERKRLNNITAEQLIKQYLPDSFAKAHFYLCGPYTYMRMVRLTLLFMGVNDEQIRKENFVLETTPATTQVSNFEPQKFRIRYLNEWHNISLGQNQTLLQAALLNHLPIPYSCGSGVCAACAVKCKSGKVIMVKNEVLTDAEIQQGWVLTCTGFAVSNNVILDFE